MKRYRYLMVFFSYFILVLGNISSGQELPEEYPPGDAWVSHNMTSPVTYTYYTINTPEYRDFYYEEALSKTEKWQEENEEYLLVVYPALVTWAYNCHGFVFINSSGWLMNTSPFLPTVYQPNENGNIYTWFGGHSAFKGFGYPYLSKPGNGAVCYHTDDWGFGEHDSRWCKGTPE